jgi:hypothetical protein
MFIAAAGGVYVGINVALRSRAHDPDSFQNRTFLSIGQKLPNYELWHSGSHTKHHINDIARRGSVILVFMSSACGVCNTMVTFWNQHVIPELDDNVKLISIYDDDDWRDMDSVSRPTSFAGAEIYTTDRKKTALDGITATPSVIGLSERATIEFIVTGFDRRLDPSFLNGNL